jgi:ribose transport system permease protein
MTVSDRVRQILSRTQGGGENGARAESHRDGDIDPPQSPQARRHGLRPNLALAQEYAVVIFALAFFIALSVLSSSFLSSRNLANILDQQSSTGIVACAATLVIIAGGFDLSVGAIFGIAAVVAAQVTNAVDPAIGFLAGATAGLVLGIVNGILVTITRINTFIATLATSYIYTGVGLLLSGGTIIIVNNPGFQTLANSELFGIKITIYLFAAAALIATWILSWTTFGRSIYAVGGNEEAARLSGVRVQLVRASTFALSGLSAGIAGIVVASRTGSGQADSGTGLELVAIAAVVVGGTSIRGGAGAVWRTLCGVLVLAFIGNGIDLLGINATYQEIIEGAIIIAAVAVDAYARAGG